MKKQTASIVIAASIVAGFGVGAAAHKSSSRSSRQVGEVQKTSQPTNTAPDVATATTLAKGPLSGGPQVEVKEPVWVTNHDGSATLSATLINRTDSALDLNDAFAGDPDENDGPALLVYGNRSHVSLEPGVPTSIGRIDDAYRIRLRDQTYPEAKIKVSLGFVGHDYLSGGADAVFTAKVVVRSAVHGGVADNGPNKQIEVHGAEIVVIPGQKQAFVGGWVTSSVEDYAYDLPTAIDPRGGRIAYRHQTATGGPYAVAAVAGKKIFFGRPPFRAADLEGSDADYFLAKDVTVGETIMVTMRFPSGDVVAPFKVVRGNLDGTVG